MRGNQYFDDDFGHDRELMRERGDLVVGRHVIRTGIDLMNLAMDSAMETQRVIGEREALRIEVKEANARTADMQVARTQAETEVRRLKERLDRTVTALDEERAGRAMLRQSIVELAEMYLGSSAKPDNAVVAGDLKGLLLTDEGDEA